MILCDASALIALLSRSDNNHQRCWEEIVSIASELTGRRVRLTVLDLISDEQKTPPSDSLAEVLKGKVGIIEGASPDLSTQTGEKFAKLMQEKHPKREELS